MFDRFSALMSASKRLAPALALPLLAGCNFVVLNPAGYVAEQQRNIILISTALMLLIIVPVMVLTVVFAWHYRSTNTQATYDPSFDHSTALELVIWSAPLLIIITLGALTWWSTHLLDPFRPLERISATQAVPANMKPLRVEVVSLDWKWLFIYPDQGIATVNELAVPVGVPVRFDMTSTNMMNTFDVPTMAGMIYTMPGMRSTLHAVLNKPVESTGFSGNYSGAGFSDMNFRVHGLLPSDFNRWVAGVKRSPLQLDDGNFAKLVRPSEKVAPIHFSAIQPDLFRRVVERCFEPGKACMSDMMTSDAQRSGNQQDLRPGTGMHLTQKSGAEPPDAARGGDQPSRNMSMTRSMHLHGKAGAAEPINA